MPWDKVELSRENKTSQLISRIKRLEREIEEKDGIIKVLRPKAEGSVPQKKHDEIVEELKLEIKNLKISNTMLKKNKTS